MDAQEFLDRTAGILEVPSVTPETDFRAGPLWDSLTAFALRVMIDQRCGKRLSGFALLPRQETGAGKQQAGTERTVLHAAGSVGEQDHAPPGRQQRS